MKNQILLAAALFAFTLVGCNESASVQGVGAAKLTLVKPASVTLQQGGMAKADIKIARKDLPGEVTIRFTNLPPGVDVVERDQKLVGDQGSYTLRASANADLVDNYSADVTAIGGPGGISVSEPINISVKAAQ